MEKANLTDIAQGLGKLHEKIDEIRIDSAKHTVILAHHSEILERNTDSLIEHIRRTDLLESKFGTVEHHVTKVETISKTLGKVVTILSIIISAVWAIVSFVLK